MARKHDYRVTVTWTGDRGTGTSGYRAYGRDHTLQAGSKPSILGSADPVFHGDAGRYSPEELFVGTLSACHMLWYLHLCSDRGVVVQRYRDEAEGVMEIDATGGGRFTRVTLRPQVTIAHGSAELARELHQEAHARCFIANSVNFPVHHEPSIYLGEP